LSKISATFLEKHAVHLVPPIDRIDFWNLPGASIIEKAKTVNIVAHETNDIRRLLILNEPRATSF
jgi:hypothetical protein